MSDRLRRLHGDPVGPDPDEQSFEFVELCVREGMSVDATVVLARKHSATLEAAKARSTYEDDVDLRLVDLRVERLVARVRNEYGMDAADATPFLEWGPVAGASGQPDDCLAGLVRPGDSTSIVGPSKIGKSLLVLDAVASKAAGRPFLGRQSAAGTVLYWDCENRPQVIKERLSSMGFCHTELRDLRYVSLPKQPRLDTAEGAAEAMQLVERTGAELFVIDTTQRVLGGEEESSTGIRNMYRYFLAPLRRQGVAVLRIDHFGKDAARGVRGSSAKVDDVDESYEFTQSKGGLLQLRRTHSRYAPERTRVLLRRSDNPLRHELVATPDPADADSELDEDLRGRPRTAQELVEALDELGLPDDHGRPKLAQALKINGMSYRTEALAEAARIRKSRSSARV